MPLEIVIATGNPHKVEEIGAIFASEGLDARLLGLNDIPGAPFPEPAETGRTFEENATIKALAYANATGRLCLADDSGLEVDALEGRPGVISSHYSTDGREIGMTRAQRDEANNARVLRELDGVAPAERAARFRCVMVLARPAGRESTGASSQRAATISMLTRGTFEGRIWSPEGRNSPAPGKNGFGYDPIFLVAPDYTTTSAELSPEEKNARSHRGEAARRLAAWLRGSTPDA